MNTSVYDLREGLQELARNGDAVCGGEWSDVLKWHAGVVEYVRAALGDGPADDVANRLRVTRGVTQAERESNAIGFVKDWLSTQDAALTADKIDPKFDGKMPKAPTKKPVPAASSAGSSVIHAATPATKEKAHGDIGPKD